MRKFLTKTRVRLLILGLLTVIIIAAAGNVSLMANRDMIAAEVNGYFDDNISIGSVYYVFPNKIIVTPVRVHKAALTPGASSLLLSGIAVRFSVWNLLATGKLSIPSVTVYSSKVSYYALSQFFEDNYVRILELIRNSPGNDLKVRILETLLYFDRQGVPDYIAMEIVLNFSGEMMQGTGLFRADQYSFSGNAGAKPVRTAKGWPLWYTIGGSLTPNGFSIDRLIFNSGNFYSKLWGSLQGGLLKINGFALMDSTKQNADEMDRSISRYIRNFPTDSKLIHIDTYLLDMDGRIRLAYPDIEVEQFNVNYNNIPVTLQGNVSLVSPLTVDAGATLRVASASGGWQNYLQDAQVSIHSVWKENALASDGHMEVKFKNSGKSRLAPDQAKFTFSGLNVRLDANKGTVLDLSDGNIVYSANQKEHKISVREFNAVTRNELEGFKTIEMAGPFCRGTMNGRVWFDYTQIPAKVSGLVFLNDVETDALEELMAPFAKFNGRLSGKVNVINLPRLELSGDILIQNGKLTDFNFFNWVADSFGLPDLKAIDFERGAAQFAIDKSHVRLHDIRLRTADVQMGGYYEIDSQSLVTSELSLDLSRALLSKSPKFSQLMKTYDKETEFLDFDFRLSGNVDAMNFQWLPSELKRRIQGQIPDFIERKIERDIDVMMDPASKKKGNDFPGTE